MLAITVATESGPALARPSADELAALLRRMGHGLSVRYGGYADSGADGAAVGRAVAAAPTDAGLAVEWNGDPGKVIEATPLQ